MGDKTESENRKKSLGDVAEEILDRRDEIIKGILTIAEARRRGASIGPVRYDFEPGFTGLIIETLAGLVLDFGRKPNRTTENDQLEKAFRDLILENVIPRVSGENVFVQMGEDWLIKYKGNTSFFGHLEGFSYIAYLLRWPNKPVPVYELKNASQKTAGPPVDTKARILGEGLQETTATHAPIKNGFTTIKQEWSRLKNELNEAQKHNDPGRSEIIQLEMQKLEDEAQRFYGAGSLSGKSRRGPVNKEAEQLRQNINKRINGAINRISENRGLPGLAEHLKTHIKTGRIVEYSTTPETGVSWEIFTKN